MAFSVASQYNKRRVFNIETDGFEYRSLEDLYQLSGGDEELPYTVRGIYINTKGLFDESPVVAIDDCYVNLPSHLCETARLMLNDARAIIAINNGSVGFKIQKYHQKKYNKDCYTVEWVDL